MLMAAMLLPFASQAQTLPFSEGFGTSIPSGWSMHTGLVSNVFNGTALTSATYGWNFGTNNGLNDNHARVNIYGTSCNKWLVTPSIALTGVSNPQLSFDLAFTAYSGSNPAATSNIADDKFMVIISTDDGVTWSATNATVWMVPDSVTVGAADYDLTALPYNTFQTFTIDLTSYVGSTIKIAFYAESTVSGGDNNLHIDNVYVGAPITCFAVSALTVSAATNNSLTLTWVDTINSAASYTIYNMADTSVAAANVSGTSYTVTGLNANTAYSFAVMANCGAGDVSALSSVVSGRTACDAIATLPYTMGFEADDLQGTTNALRLPFCWSRYASGTGSYTYYPYSNTSYVHEGSRALYYYCGTTASYPDTQAVILPELDVTSYPMNGNRVTFWARMSSASYSNLVYVGTLSDPTDISTFTLVDTVRVSGNTHTKYAVSLANATSTDAYVVIASLRNATNQGYMAIDDVTLEVLPSCPDIASVSVADVTSSSITLSWSSVDGATGYTVLDATGSIVATATDTTYTVTGLDANTQYTFRVQSNCTTGDGASATVSGRTACAAIATLPYFVDFEDASSSQMPSCWDRPGGTGLYVSSSTSYNHTTDGSMYMRFYSGSNRYAVMPEIVIPSDGLQVKFWTRPESNTNSLCADFQVGYMTNVADITTFVAVETYHYNDWASASYEERTVNMTSLPAGARIAFYHTGTAGWYWFLDDITVDNVPSCVAPASLASSNITASGATLTWNGTADSYTVYNMADTSLVATVTTTSYDLTGLNANTAYTFGVVSNCGTENSDIAIVSFTTACGSETMPWSENFDSWTAKSPCWSFLSGAYNMGAGTPTPSTPTGGWSLTSISYGSNITISGNALAFNLYSTNRYWAVTPVVSITSATAQLSVDVAVAAWSSATPNYDADDTLAFAASTDGGTTWTTLRVLTNTELNALANTFTTINVPVLGYNGQDVRFAIFAGSSAGDGDNRIVIDNVAVGEAPSCMAITDLTIDSVSANSVLLSWSDAANTGATYSVYNGTTQVATNVANTSYEVTGLTASTAYTFGVVANCSATDASTMATIDATTACGGTTCTITIVGTDEYDSWNGASITISQNDATIGTYTVASSTSPYTGTFSVCSGMPVSFSWNYGNYDDECDFVIYNGNNDSVFAGNGDDMYGTFFTLATPCAATVDTTGNDTTGNIAITFAVNDATMGTTVPAPGTYYYSEGETMTVTAMPNAGYHVSDWTMTIEGQAMSLQTDTTTIADVIASYYDGLIITAVFAANSSDTGSVQPGCDPVSLPFTEDFEANSTTYNCWSQNNMASGSGPSTMKYYSGAQSFGFQYTTEPPAYLISPELTGTDNGVQVEFSYAIRSNTYPESFQVGYSTTTNAPTAFTWGTEQTNLTNTNFERYSEIFGVSGIKYVAVKYTAYDAWTLYIDSLVVKEAPSCTPVMALAVDSATANSIFLSWTSSNNSATYTIYNMADTSVVASGVTATSYTVTGLTAATTYTFGVVANCSATDVSSMASVTTMTACDDVTTLPYSEGFESGLGCWTTVNGSSDGQPWFAIQNQNSITAHSGTGMAVSVSYYSGAVHANAWLISPKFVLPTTNDSIKLSWWFRVDGGYPEDKYEVRISTTTNDTASFTTQLFSILPDSTHDSWTQQVVDLTAYAGQSVYVAFHHYDSYDADLLLLDDIELFQGAYVPPAPDTLTVTFATANAVMGTTDPTPGTYQYLSGDTVRFNAVPNAGYHFSYWVLAYNGMTDTVTYQSAYGTTEMFLNYYSSNVTLTAYFEAGNPDSVAVTYTVNDATMGSINPSGMQYVYVGSPIQAEATANSGYELVEWNYTVYDSTGAVLGGDSWYADDDDFANPMTIGTMPQNFADNGYTLTMTAVFGVGSIVSEDSLVLITDVNDATMGTIIPAPGTHVLHAGDTFSVRAVPNDGYHVSGWHIVSAYNGYTYSDDTLNLPLTEIHPLDTVGDNLLGMTISYTAIFAPGAPVDYMTVTTIVNDTTMGSLTPQGTNVYHEGDTVQMGVSVNPGYYLYSLHVTMSHPLYGTEDTTLMGDDVMAGLADLGLFDTAIVVDEYLLGASITVSAIFAAEGTVPEVYNVTVGYDMSRGTVTGAGQYVENSSVTLTAVAFPGYEFYAWVENNDTVGRNTVYTIDSIDRDHYLTAVFVVKTGIADVESDDVNVYSVDDVIVVRGAEGKSVVLFDVNGRMLSREARAAERVEFRVNNSGVYLVKVADAAAKRVVVLR